VFEDLVMAIQSLNGVYGQPYCPVVSLDTKPGGFARLPQKLAETDADKAAFRRACIAYVGGITRVLGMPHDCRSAKVLLDADFRMKQASWSADYLEVDIGYGPPHFLSQFWDFRAYVMQGINTPPDPHPGRYVRNWFEPGKQTYIEDRASVFMDCVQVVLKDMHHEADGSEQKEDKYNETEQIVSRGWTCAWTNKMNEVVRSEPIWADMYSVFRHVALARVLMDQSTKAKQINLGPVAMELLKNYRPTFVAVPPEMVTAEFHRMTAEQYSKTKYHLARFCGGIDMAGRVTPSAVSGTIRADIRLVEQTVLESMKSCGTASCWNVR
jgi:hypothetical protein